MAIRYLFPCPQCGEKNLISATMAGQETNCSKCGSSFEVPQLKILKSFEPSEPVLKPKPIRTSSRPRILFVVGILLSIVGFVFGYDLLRYGKSIRADFSNGSKEIQELADRLGPNEILREWYRVERNPELPEWKEHPAIRYDTQGKILTNIAYGLLAIGGIGLLLLGFALLTFYRLNRMARSHA